MNDLVSIVLPVYNGQQFLRESIESVINQTYKNWELLILDDCSTDSTPEIIAEYLKLDNRIRYIRNEYNLKLPGNLNKGFSLARGSYFTWTSDDNRFHNNAIEVMHKVICENKADLVYASYQIIDENNNNIQVIYADTKGRQHILGSNVVGACFMYSRAAYEYTGEYDKDLFLVEDFDYWQRMMSKFAPIAITDVLYDYRWHDKSLTSTKNKKIYGERLEKMLIENRKLYNKIGIEANCYYYSCLKTSYEAQSKRVDFKYRLKLFSALCWLKNLFHRVAKFKRK